MRISKLLTALSIPILFSSCEVCDQWYENNGNGCVEVRERFYGTYGGTLSGDIFGAVYSNNEMQLQVELYPPTIYLDNTLPPGDMLGSLNHPSNITDDIRIIGNTYLGNPKMTMEYNYSGTIVWQQISPNQPQVFGTFTLKKDQLIIEYSSSFGGSETFIGNRL